MTPVASRLNCRQITVLVDSSTFPDGSVTWKAQAPAGKPAAESGALTPGPPLR
jgi:hypothetical protein